MTDENSPRDTLAAQVLEAARARGLTIATAESCTGGLIAAALTEIAGSSDVFDLGFVTYSNAAKTAQLGVPEALLAQVGAVSEQTAGAMAQGALATSTAALAVSVTGVAGPGGGSAEKPVGLVCFGLAVRGQTPRTLTRRFGPGSRREIRGKATLQGLELLLEAAQAG
jgi:nicotinamide-nucleotide amidase